MERKKIQNAYISADGLNNLERLALLAYRLFGEGPVDFHRLRYEFVKSPLFAHIEGDWFVKSLAYVILSTDVLEERDGKYYIKKKYIEKIKKISLSEDANVSTT